MTPELVRTRLGLPEDTAAWLDRLDRLGPPPEPVRLPRGDEARELLARLDVPDRDADELVAGVPAPGSVPELWWLLERTHHMLVRDMGGYGPLPGGPTLPYELGPAARWFYVYVFLSTVPVVLTYHRDRGVPDEVSWATLADLGEKVGIHRRKYGEGGMNTQAWFPLHLRGAIYRLGRLQFNLMRADGDRGALRAGQPLLGTHIPEAGGPMTAVACDDSFARAGPFFGRHFPEHGARVAVCTSWLLDPQLAEYLPKSSNIAQFLRRWTQLDEPPERGDRSVLEFVFRRGGQPLRELPQRTALERAVVAHLRDGRHWHVRTGWLQLP